MIAFGCSNNKGLQPHGNIVNTSGDLKKGEAFFNSNTKKDSAFYYFVSFTETSKDSLQVAMAYTYMAMIQEDAGDYLGSQESALDALHHVNEKNPEHQYCLSSIYNELGATSAGLKNYDDAIEYYDLAIKYQQDEAYKIVAQNNKAVVYRDKGDYRKAIELFREALEKQRGNKLEYARVLTNLATAQWMADNSFNPLPGLLSALNMRVMEKDEIGITASFNHLSDYYRSHNHDSAFFYAKNMYSFAQRINSTDKKLEALRKLVVLAPAAESKSYSIRYQFLDDSVQDARNKAKNQYALIKYRSEKNKTENLQLQQENSSKQLEILRQRVLMYGIVILVTLVFIFLLWWIRKKRQKLEWQSQTAIRENELRTSQKVHDTVANGLYRLMSEIEHQAEIDKDVLLDKIEKLYERSRNISYETNGEASGDAQRINELLQSFATPGTKISIVGNQEKIWDLVTPQTANELEQILLELMINMSKHSQAQYVVVRFILADDALTISYRDDGIGFQPDFKYGNGLKSTENRISRIGGRLIFATESTAGASIKIVIPTRNT